MEEVAGLELITGKLKLMGRLVLKVLDNVSWSSVKSTELEPLHKMDKTNILFCALLALEIY